MIRFPSLEQFDVTSIMSDQSDGDCRDRNASEAFTKREDIALTSPLHLLNQVHSAKVVDACSEHDGVDADGLVTSQTNHALGIRIADCVPVFLFDPQLRAGALVHAGRAGTYQQIASQAVQSLGNMYGSHPENIHAVIGPSAGPCCYEVSTEMAKAFSKQGGIAQGRHLDLWATNRQQLIQSGIPDEHIHTSGHCTICMPGFYSYRGNAPTERNLAVLCIHEPPERGEPDE